MSVSRVLTILTVCCFFVKSGASAETLYACMDDRQAGLKASENYRTTTFYEERFTAKIDTNKPSIWSEKLALFSSDSTCIFSSQKDEFTCTNGWGMTLTLNLKTMNFARSYNATEGDDPFIAFGSCERF